MIIQVDVDSTLYDSSTLFAKVAKDYHEVDLPINSNNWHAYYDYAEADVLHKVFRKSHSREMVEQQVPYDGAVEVLAEIAGRGHDVFYVSDRHPQAAGALKDWLLACGFLTEATTNVIVGKDKRQWMRQTNPEMVIDDRVRTMMMARFELGSTVFSIAQPWNTNLYKEVDGIHICKDWAEIGSEIERYL